MGQIVLPIPCFDDDPARRLIFAVVDYSTAKMWDLEPFLECFIRIEVTGERSRSERPRWFGQK